VLQQQQQQEEDVASGAASASQATTDTRLGGAAAKGEGSAGAIGAGSKRKAEDDVHVDEDNTGKRARREEANGIAGGAGVQERVAEADELGQVAGAANGGPEGQGGSAVATHKVSFFDDRFVCVCVCVCVCACMNACTCENGCAYAMCVYGCAFAERGTVP
jgi:hypothetical protein